MMPTGMVGRRQMTRTADHDDTALSLLGRVLGVAFLAVGVTLVFMFAAAAAVVVGLMIAGASLTMRFAPRPATVRSDLLEARRTPAGWVVETRTRRPS